MDKQFLAITNACYACLGELYNTFLNLMF